MLSEKEKKEILEMASSEKMREEFRTLRDSSRLFRSSPCMDLNELIKFLTAVNRIFPPQQITRSPLAYPNIRL
ncbi:MAG: hypothetical protein HY399_03195 [Elusimicrobia bacterium]|nr:hypothetical protein [Elusimicrobiota bacterium]